MSSLGSLTLASLLVATGCALSHERSAPAPTPDEREPEPRRPVEGCVAFDTVAFDHGAPVSTGHSVAANDETILIAGWVGLDATEVQVAAYDGAGRRVGEGRMATGPIRYDVDVAPLSSGGFVVYWTEDTGDGWRFVAERVSAEGVPAGERVTLGHNPPGDFWSMEAAARGDELALIWSTPRSERMVEPALTLATHDFARGTGATHRWDWDASVPALTFTPDGWIVVFGRNVESMIARPTRAHGVAPDGESMFHVDLGEETAGIPSLAPNPEGMVGALVSELPPPGSRFEFRYSQIAPDGRASDTALIDTACEPWIGTSLHAHRGSWVMGYGCRRPGPDGRETIRRATFTSSGEILEDRLITEIDRVAEYLFSAATMSSETWITVVEDGTVTRLIGICDE